MATINQSNTEHHFGKDFLPKTLFPLRYFITNTKYQKRSLSCHEYIPIIGFCSSFFLSLNTLNSALFMQFVIQGAWAIDSPWYSNHVIHLNYTSTDYILKHLTIKLCFAQINWHSLNEKYTVNHRWFTQFLTR